MLTCKEVTHLVSQSLDRQMPFRTRVGVRMHLAMCRFCRRYRRQLLFLRKVGRWVPSRLEGNGAPPLATLPPDARRRIQEALDSAGRT